jgi:hypothetical protein
MWMQATEGFRGAYVAAAGLVACATVSLRLFLNLVSVALGVRPVCPVLSLSHLTRVSAGCTHR